MNDATLESDTAGDGLQASIARQRQALAGMITIPLQRLAERCAPGSCPRGMLTSHGFRPA
ncbi:hypothetical protein [Thiohalobacter thiocyanaticus]|uniref:hypothetical protein n=1 Tax=Thiohalobacter thiocyanaticus TaxID=585455 RepID=UPI001F4DDC60|nr:hypothetical protein [Thiohalobacter thiocyanaticus]